MPPQRAPRGSSESAPFSRRSPPQSKMPYLYGGAYASPYYGAYGSYYGAYAASPYYSYGAYASPYYSAYSHPYSYAGYGYGHGYGYGRGYRGCVPRPPSLIFLLQREPRC